MIEELDTGCLPGASQARAGGLVSRDGVPATEVLQVPVSLVNMDSAASAIDSWIARDERQYVCVTGVHGVMESTRDPALLEIHRRAGLVVPDGMPLVWIARRRGFEHVDRVYGPDLLLEVCGSSIEKGRSHYFYGGAEGVPELLAQRLSARFPDLRVAGAFSPPFRPLTPEEDRSIVEKINEAAPDIVWVGLSTPKQERWMAANVGRLAAPVLIGVGAAFDFHAGLKPQAPEWMQRNGLEWLFRMASEPRRLGPRYLRNNPEFVYRFLAERVAGRTSAGARRV